MTPIIGFRKPKPAPPRLEEYCVTLDYGDYSLTRHVNARGHADALDAAHEHERRENPHAPLVYNGGYTRKTSGKKARQEAYA